MYQGCVAPRLHVCPQTKQKHRVTGGIFFQHKSVRTPRQFFASARYWRFLIQAKNVYAYGIVLISAKNFHQVYKYLKYILKITLRYAGLMFVIHFLCQDNYR